MIIKRSSLGRPVQPGDLYDVISDQFTGLNVFKKDLPDKFIHKSKCRYQRMKHDLSNSKSLKFSLLEIEAESRLNLMCDAVLNVSGSAAFIQQNYSKKEEMRCTFALCTRTGEHKINVGDSDMREYFREDIKDSNGTHVVVGLVWGTNVTVELFIDAKDERSKMEIETKLEANIGKIGDILHINGNTNMQYQDIELSNITNIRFKTDGALNVVPPNNAQEALNIIQSLSQQSKDDENDQVMEFYLIPLSTLKEHIGQTHGVEYILRKVENNIIKNVEIILEESEQRRLEIASFKDFLQQNKELAKHEEIKKVCTFLNSFDIAFAKFKHSIAEKLKEIRSGSANSDELDRIWQEFVQHPEAGIEKVDEFLILSQTTKQKIESINQISRNGIIFIKTPAEFDSMLREKRFIYVLSYSPEKSNNFNEVYWQFLDLKKSKNQDQAVFVIIDLDVTPTITIDNHVLSTSPIISRICEGRLVCRNVLEEARVRTQQERVLTELEETGRALKWGFGAAIGITVVSGVIAVALDKD